MSQRIAPATPPLEATVARRLEERMAGRPALVLFTTLARDPRLFHRFFDGSLLDTPSHLSLRQRELVIDRTCALCDAEYEWGVHVALFGERAGLTKDQIASTDTGSATDACWSAEDRVLVALCDVLHATSDIDDALWAELRTHFSEEALIELLMLAGRYRLVSYMVKALRLPLEPYGARFQGRARRVSGNVAPRVATACALTGQPRMAAATTLEPSIDARLAKRGGNSGRPPLVLFTTMARDLRLFNRFFDGGLLDRGNLTIRQREIIIDRTTALNGAEYEWGVHVAVFGEKAGLTEPQVRSTAVGKPEDDCWSPEDRLLMQLCDELHASCDVDDVLWAELAQTFSEPALMEMLMLAGQYRTVSYLTRVLRLPLESFQRHFPQAS